MEQAGAAALVVEVEVPVQPGQLSLLELGAMAAYMAAGAVVD